MIHNFTHLGINSDYIDPSYDRISRQDLYMQMAFLCSKRSHDSQTQHGAVIIKNDRVISTGVNGFPPNMPDTLLPNTRPEKYKFINHAEENAILSAAKIGIALEGATLYVTGLPCVNCARQLITVGIKDWICGPIGHVRTQQDEKLLKFWIQYGRVDLKLWDG